MTSRLNPYINFGGQAREAMSFYESVFGGTLTMNTFGEFGDKSAPNADQIMHAQLITDLDFAIMAADGAPGVDVPSPTSNISISLSGDDADALRGYWDALSSGGSIEVALEKQMWGDEFGACTDRYGVAWMVNITQST
jgi:PhnB protein